MLQIRSSRAQPMRKWPVLVGPNWHPAGQSLLGRTPELRGRQVTGRPRPHS